MYLISTCRSWCLFKIKNGVQNHTTGGGQTEKQTTTQSMESNAESRFHYLTRGQAGLSTGKPERHLTTNVNARD